MKSKNLKEGELWLLLKLAYSSVPQKLIAKMFKISQQQVSILKYKNKPAGLKIYCHEDTPEQINKCLNCCLKECMPHSKKCPNQFDGKRFNRREVINMGISLND
ncbi:hypothetical protein M0R19_05520 [Candidatus Pacearchaeota archaeon]|jgi:hypothetical protein|nr:hypothetical protein [Candidatus Pacearchaeota archaeon]